MQELEDTYGVKMSDEEAAQITTVRAAVDFVVERAPPSADDVEALRELFDALPEELRRQALTHSSWVEPAAGRLRAARVPR